MRQMGHIPEHNVSLLDSLIVLVIPELASCSEISRNIFVHIGTANGHIKIGKFISLSIIP